jgi:hypothetical protein
MKIFRQGHKLIFLIPVAETTMVFPTGITMPDGRSSKIIRNQCPLRNNFRNAMWNAGNNNQCHSNHSNGWNDNPMVVVITKAGKGQSSNIISGHKAEEENNFKTMNYLL